MDFKIRNLNENDYKEYLDLLYELTNFKSTIEQSEFNQYLQSDTIIKVLEYKNEIIGAGSLFILKKIHCNPFGQIEDVIVKKEFRGMGLGKKLIDHLVTIGLSLNCYKICLNSLETNKNFYLKLHFIQSGLQFSQRVASTTNG